MDENDELSTWAEIAGYLGVSIRTAQDYERFQGMPVHRLGGKKPRVWAYRAEIDAWKRGAGAPVPDAAEVEGPAGEAATPDPRNRSIARRWWRTAAVVGVLILAGIATSMLRVRREATHFRVAGNDLVALDVHDNEVWRHTFPQLLGPLVAYSGVSTCWCGALFEGGDSLCIAGTTPAESNGQGGTVTCFRRDGRVLWQFVPGREVDDEGGSHMLPPYYVSAVVGMRGSQVARIVVISHHHMEQACQVAFLDTRGNVVGEYWHPGHLDYTAEADVDGDGRDELLLGGVNNGNHQATLVALDPWQVRGVSTPAQMKDRHFRLLGMPEAKEKAVIFFPRSCDSTGKLYTRVKGLRVTAQRVIVEVAEGTHDEIVDGAVVYEFDHRLNPVESQATDARYKDIHDALQAKGILHHAYNPREAMALKDHVEERRSW